MMTLSESVKLMIKFCEFFRRRTFGFKMPVIKLNDLVSIIVEET